MGCILSNYLRCEPRAERCYVTLHTQMIGAAKNFGCRRSDTIKRELMRASESNARRESSAAAGREL